MKSINLLLASLALVQLSASQDTTTNIPSASVSAGIFVSGQRNFSAIYGSTLCFASAVTVRFPLSERFFAIAKGSAVFRRNKGYELRQWIGDLGPGYMLPISENLVFTGSAGLAFTIFLDTFPTITSPIGSTRGDMNYGTYLALGVDRSVPSWSSAFYLEAYYSYLPRKYITYTHNFGGAEFFAGIRYFFRR